MRILSAALLILSSFSSHSLCFDLKCVDPSTVRCVVSDVIITSPNNLITSINGNTDPDLVYTELTINSQNVKFMPTNIAKFFPKLEKLEISNSSLEWIEQANIKELTSLRTLNLNNNNLRLFEEGLFDFNTKLEIISVRENNLNFVHQEIFYKLSKLQSIDLEQNLCTTSMNSGNNDYDYHYNYNRRHRTTYFKQDPYAHRDSVLNFLQSHCQSWETAYNIYMTLSKSWINRLKSENEKVIEGLTHQLKTCDGNLDAALTNYHQQKIMGSSIVSMTMPNDLPVINLSCENESCVAVDFKVSFANTSIDSELYKEQTIKSLKIYQQQTLFLPQNLDEHFSQLNELSVTESGLYEIEFNVFVGLNLSLLNLTNNKIPEIPVDTFADLNNLQVLDLSFNKIHSLFDDVFASLKSLQQLYLNHNYLTSIQIEVVRNLESLRGLYLQGNRLKFISATLLTPLTYLKSVDLTGNACINMNHPTSSLVDIEATIIDNCIEPVELSCKSYRIETSENVENTSYCSVDSLLIEYPKTKISMLRNNKQEMNNSEPSLHVKIFVVDSQSIKFLPFQLSQHFPNLERIEILKSNLTTLHLMDFDGFLELSEIVINNNNLSSISEGTFDTVPQLELLDLSSNGITILPKHIFVKLTRLHTLILSHNQIVRFMADLLPRRNVIETFRADNNQLEFIETRTIRFLRKAKLIDLTGNVCIDMQFAKTENRTRALVELSGEIDLNCSADDLYE
ncbi:protein slit-like [Bradysia coprophila]|uniref:protein slit-like n=1 Tax=Bradysia coprophila TaxID=38358 RepID=UPI00187D759C|nr:protein slit-like [Bradysia coprophila]